VRANPFSSRAAWLVLALIVIALVGAGCAPATPAGPAATNAPTQTVAPPSTATTAPVAAPAQPGAAVNDLPAGVDADGNFYRGDPNATVKLIEFSDFQCSGCSYFAQQVAPLLDEAYVATGKAVFVFRHFPLSIHPNALPAAKAAYCAGQQKPELFWKLHNWLFANQETWANAQDAAAQIRAQALALDTDATEFDSCVANAATEARIQRDYEEGQRLGVAGTPNLFANDWNLWKKGLPEIQEAIDKALQGIHPPPTPTPLPPGVAFFDLDPARPGFTYDGSPSLGAADAPLVLVSFEDFKSPAGAQYVSTVEPTLKSKYIDSGQVRQVFKFFPDTAPKAAVAALCAARQDKFWEFRNLLYTEQAQWQEGDEAVMGGYATRVGLDGAAFTDCLADKAARGEVDASYQFGQEQIGVPTTPSFLLIKVAASGQAEDVKGLAGAQTLDVFEQAIQDLLHPPTPTPTK